MRESITAIYTCMRVSELPLSQCGSYLGNCFTISIRPAKTSNGASSECLWGRGTGWVSTIRPAYNLQWCTHIHNVQERLGREASPLGGGGGRWVGTMGRGDERGIEAALRGNQVLQRNRLCSRSRWYCSTCADVNLQYHLRPRPRHLPLPLHDGENMMTGVKSENSDQSVES